MAPWLQDIFGWLPTGIPYYLLLGMISFFESLAVIGIFVPGSVLIVFAGFLAAHGQGAYPPLVAVAAVGAILGDLFSYWLGAHLGSRLHSWRLLRKRQELLQRAEDFFLAHGGKSVFAGRFVGFLRPFIPLVAGGSRMRPLPFFSYALISGLLWGLAYPGLGYFFGSSWALVKVWTGRFGLFVTTLVLLLILDIWFWKRIAPVAYRQWGRLWARIRRDWGRILRTPLMTAGQSRFPGLYAFLAERFTLRHGSGLYLTVGFLFSALFALLFFTLVRAVNFEPTMTGLDRYLHQLIPQLHHPAADRLMFVITSLGDNVILALLTVWIIVWLLLDNRYFTALLVTGGMAGGEILVFGLKIFFQRQRPDGFFPHLQPASASFPSAHAFLSLLFIGLLVYILLDHLREGRSRFYLVLTGSFIVLLVGFSRLYLGVHWLSDVLGGLALAGIWLSFLITALEVRGRYGGEHPWRPQWQPVRLKKPWRLLILAIVTIALVVSVGGYSKG